VSSHEWSGSGSACFEAVHCEYLILRLFLALPLLLMYITAHPRVKLGGKPPKNIINCNTWEKVTKKKSGKNSGRKKLKTTESFGTLDMRTSGCIILANEEIFESHSWINVLKFDYSFFFLNFARIDSIHQEYSCRHFNTPKKVMYTNSDGCKPCVHHRKISTLTP